MTLREKIAKEWYENTWRGTPRKKAPWDKTDEITKDAYRQDADKIMTIIKEDRLEEMSREYRPKVYDVDINGDQ
jgi:hypothetical protein